MDGNWSYGRGINDVTMGTLTEDSDFKTEVRCNLRGYLGAVRQIFKIGIYFKVLRRAYTAAHVERIYKNSATVSSVG